MANWYDNTDAVDDWVGTPPSNDDVLTSLLAVAKQQVIAYAPSLPIPDPVVDPEVIPDNYRYYQLMQARNIWNAGQVDSGGGIGDGEFVMKPHPLDWQIKQGLRPRRGAPRVR